MRNLYNIIEGILDDDEVVSSKITNDIVVSQLIDNGIYYACSRTKARFEVACNNEIASYKNGVLSFINDDIKAASEVTIDYDKAKTFLKKSGIKCIEAPKVSIFDITGDDFSFFGEIKARFLKIYEPEKTIKNLHFDLCRPIAFTVIENADIHFRRKGTDFCGSRMGTYPNTTIKVETYDDTTFTDCKISADILTISGEDVNFKNCSGTLLNISLYDPSLFNGFFGKKVFQLFDPNHKFNCYVNPNMQKERKTTSIRRILAYFGNKKFFAPDDTPYKVIGTLKKICDVSGFKDLVELAYHDNNYSIGFTKDLELARRLLHIDSLHYVNNNWKEHQVEQTKDGYYVVIYTNR